MNVSLDGLMAGPDNELDWHFNRWTTDMAELLGEQLPSPLYRIGMQDRFGESGAPEELMTHFGLDAKHIALAAHHVIDRK